MEDCTSTAVAESLSQSASRRPADPARRCTKSSMNDRRALRASSPPCVCEYCPCCCCCCCCCCSRATSSSSDSFASALASMSRSTCMPAETSAHVSTRQHTSAHVSTRQHTSVHVSTRQHTSAHVSAGVHVLVNLSYVCPELVLADVRILVSNQPASQKRRLRTRENQHLRRKRPPPLR